MSVCKCLMNDVIRDLEELLNDKLENLTFLHSGTAFLTRM